MFNRIREIKGKEPSNNVHHLSVNDRDANLIMTLLMHWQIKNIHNSSSTFSTVAFTSVPNKGENGEVYILLYGNGILPFVTHLKTT